MTNGVRQSQAMSREAGKLHTRQHGSAPPFLPNRVCYAFTVFPRIAPSQSGDTTETIGIRVQKHAPKSRAKSRALKEH